MESKVSLNFRYKYDLEDLSHPSTGGNIVKSRIDEGDKRYNFLLEVDNEKVASILGLGYGTGAAKLQNVLKLGAGVEFDENECKRLVKIYRDVNYKVTDFWRTCENALQDLVSWPSNKKPYYLDKHNVLLVDSKGIKLPNGLYIRYPDIRRDTSEVNARYLYRSRRGEITVWGGSVVENVVQALARCIVAEQMLKVSKKYLGLLIT